MQTCPCNEHPLKPHFYALVICGCIRLPEWIEFRNFFLILFLIVVQRPGKQFFSHVETEPPIPEYYQYFWGASCSRKQHTDTAKD